MLDMSNETAPDDPLAAQIARALEEEIVFGRLKPGQKLREEELAERFAGSRHQVREALARLGRIGIVTKERNRGVSVRRFSASEVRQIYEVREILQRQAALRIPLPVDDAIIVELLKIHEAYERESKPATCNESTPRTTSFIWKCFDFAATSSC